MKKNFSIFQIVVMAIFGILALLGFLFFSTYKPVEKKGDIVKVGKVSIWGTYPKETMDFLIKELIEINENYQEVVYFEKPASSFKLEFLEAIAEGNSPDLILISQKDLLDNLNKLYKIPYSSISSRTFKDTYLDAFSIFDSGSGIYAIPFSIDPMVMYYNKTIFNSEGVALPPKEWKEFVTLSPKLTKKDTNNNILKSTISFGETINVTHYKDIISTLFFQSGNDIVGYDNKGRLKTINFTEKEKNPVNSLVFFNEFSNQLSPIYSWNRTLPNSKDYFIAGNLATYFGFASEIINLRKKNPNLNFDIAEIPSTSGTFDKTVFANIWGLAISKNGKNISGAYNVANAFASSEIQKLLVEKIYLPPVRKDLVAETAKDSFMDIFYKEAIYSKTWIDPNYKSTDKIFKYMVESIKSGSATPSESVRDSYREIDYLLGS